MLAQLSRHSDNKFAGTSFHLTIRDRMRFFGNSDCLLDFIELREDRRILKLALGTDVCDCGMSILPGIFGCKPTRRFREKHEEDAKEDRENQLL